MARTKRAPANGLPVDPDAPAPAETTAKAPRFPVTPAIFAELTKYGAKTGRGQEAVAKALEEDLLDLLQGRLLRAGSVDPTGAPTSYRPVASLKARGIAEMEENW